MKKLNIRRHKVEGLEGVVQIKDRHFRTNWYGLTVECTGLTGDEIKALDIKEANYKRIENPFTLSSEKK